MPTHADLAAKLLRDAAAFFRNVGEQNPELKATMDDNADVYSQVADLVECEPTAELDLEEGNA